MIDGGGSSKSAAKAYSPPSKPAASPPSTPKSKPPDKGDHFQAKNDGGGGSTHSTSGSTAHKTQPTIPPPQPGQVVNPAVATQPPAVIREEIRKNATQQAMPPASVMIHLPPEDQGDIYASAAAKGNAAAEAFDRLYQEELNRVSPELKQHLPPEDVAALEQEARQHAVERINLGHVGGTGNVDLTSMNEQEKFNYLRDLIEDQGGTFRTEDNAMNVIGLRGLENGAVGDNAANEYNDTLFVLRYEDGKPQVYEFPATTDYGSTQDTSDAGDGVTAQTPDGAQWAPLLATEGSYTMNIGTHAAGTEWAHEALREAGGSGVISVPDLNGNHRVDPEEMQYQYTDQGINVHGGGRSGTVGQWSTGCQVIPREPTAGDDTGRLYWDDFHTMMTEDPVYGTTLDLIPYTLVDVQNAPSTTTGD
jgi:hypothetical protein